MSMYRCPKCQEPLIKEAHRYQCKNHHSFDIAKQGYVHLLLSNKKMRGDNQAMVEARTAFLSHGYYAFLRERICTLYEAYLPSVLVDAGCGEGYYTNEIKHCFPTCEVYGFDLSKHALKQGARAKTGVAYAVASVADLPMPDGCADMLQSIFAPIYIEEIKRVLKKDGYFVKVGPGPTHLWGLKQVLYETIYENEGGETYEGFTLVHQEYLEKEVDILGHEDIMALFSMTPYAYRSPKSGRETLAGLDALTTLLQFQIEIWQKRSE